LGVPGLEGVIAPSFSLIIVPAWVDK
jgi:hypothetical protein